VKVIKNINNNVAVCQDANGKELIAFGKGIGFKVAPYEIQLGQIERTYYNVDSIYISMINDLPEEIISSADVIVNYARSKINYPISSNIVFTLADHINFSIQRFQKNIKLSLPVMYDVQQLFETEMELLPI
jgi:beta-glucoside operon transcriptional antiterminator